MLTRIRVLSVVVFALACRDANAPADDLLVRTSVKPAEFRAGDHATVTVVVTNVGAVSYPIPGYECLSAFNVEAQNGDVVGPGQRTCDAVLVTRTLAPGEQFTYQQEWIGDGIRADINEPAALLPPGSYLVRGSVLAPGPRNPPALVTIAQ